MISRYPFRKIFSSPIPFLLVCGLLGMLFFGVSGCGKKGFPEPKDASRSFFWKEINAKLVGNCLAFTGSFEGAYENFDGIRLEVAPLQDLDDCPGCPFVPKEVSELSPRETGFNRKDGSVAFSYCPQPGNAYRWRLAGISRFNRLPHATMSDRILMVNPQAFVQ